MTVGFKTQQLDVADVPPANAPYHSPNTSPSRALKQHLAFIRLSPLGWLVIILDIYLINFYLMVTLVIMILMDLFLGIITK